jgi:multiple sugar transport system permease protein
MADVATLRKVPEPSRRLAASRLGHRVRRNLAAHGFLIGAVLCFTFFSWYPIVREITMSLQKAVPGGGQEWAGLDNYVRIFHDPTFWQAWRNTLEFTVLALVVGYAVPFCVAVLLNELRHARGYLRALVYLPVMLPPASALLLFAYFYNPQYGLFDHVLRMLHLPTSQWVLQPGTGFVSTAMVSVVIASTWMNMGAATLIYLAALQNIPGELYEAAELDGAGLFSRIRHITIPQTRLILLMLLLLQVVATMQMFVESFVLTNGGGGVGDNTQSVVMLIYQYAFALSGASNYNSASALGVVLMVVLAIFSGGFLWVTRERGPGGLRWRRRRPGR